jgi:cyclopropane fatty-acyl-phospholipid synthase-like methyltransferase
VNEAAICDALAKVLPAQGMVLELASGTGERASHFARTFPHLAWQPSERDPEAVAALAQRCEQTGLANLLRPIALDVALQPWPVAQVDAIVAIDYTHAVPWDQVAAAFGGGARILASDGLFFLYGPFRFHGKYAAKELEEIDLTLRARDPSLGLRDIRELTVSGTRTGLGLEHVVAVPGARHALIFRRRALLPPTGQFRVS